MIYDNHDRKGDNMVKRGYIWLGIAVAAALTAGTVASAAWLRRKRRSEEDIDCLLQRSSDLINKIKQDISSRQTAS